MKKYLSVLRNSPFFEGLSDNEIVSILHCVNATTTFKERDSYIFRAGDSTEVMGLVVSGFVLFIQEDLWGHRNILSKCHVGDFFGEPYAASPGAVLNISVVADEDCEIIFLNVQRLLVSCPTACEHHQKLIRNLEILRKVQQEAGCRILLAQKAFSMFAEYPLIGQYLSGTTASGLFEARLGKE